MPQHGQLPDAVSRLVELRPEEADLRSTVQTTRVLLLTVSVIYPLWWVFVQRLYPNFVDSLTERLMVGLVAFLGAGMTFHPQGEQAARRIGQAVSYVVVTHFFSLVWRNEADIWSSYGLLIILSGANSAQIGLGPTLRFSVLAVGLALILLVLLGPNAETMSMFGGTLAVQWMAALAAWQRDRAEQDRGAHARYALRLFERVLHELPEPVFLKDAAGTILLVNPATARAFGYTAEAMIGKKLQDLLGMTAAQPMLALDAEVLRSGAAQTALQVLPDGQGGHLTWRLVLSRLDRGPQEPFLLGVASDLTELLRQDEVLRKAKANAEAGLIAKGEFLAKMSHEIRTPMNGVLLAIEVAKSLRHGGRLAELLEIAEVSAQGLLRIVDDVLDISKMEAGELRLERDEFDLLNLLHGLERAHALQAEQKGLQWQVSVEANVPRWVVGDGTRLRQVLGNLVNNALKFTERGYVMVRVAAELQPDEKDVGLQFHVVDSGIGIDPSRQAAVLEAFVQADDSTTRRYGGTGLGLPIVRQLLARMGSELVLHSEPGLGTSFQFTLRLPVGAGHQLAEEPQRESTRKVAVVQHGLPPHAPVVCAVDDNAVNLAMLVSLIRQFDIHAHPVDDGQTAVAWSIVNQPAAVLMDVQMPDVDGLEATQRLRAAGYTGPIVAVTAQALPGDRERCLQAGMTEYLTKPVTRAALGELFALLGLVGARSEPVVARSVAVSRATLDAAVGDPELAERLLSLFAADWPRIRATITQPAPASATPGSGQPHAAAALHRLRGSLLHFGATALADSAAMLEQRCTEAGAGAEAEDLEALAAQVDVALARWRR